MDDDNTFDEGEVLDYIVAEELSEEEDSKSTGFLDPTLFLLIPGATVVYLFAGYAGI